MGKIIKILVKTKDGGVTEYNVSSDAGNTGHQLILKDTGKLTYELKDLNIKRAPDQVLAKRNGKNLEINLDVDGYKGEEVTPDIILENYYDTSTSNIIGMAEDGKYYSYIPQEYNPALMAENIPDGSFSYQSLGLTETSPLWVLALAPLALLGGGGGGGDENTPPVAADDTDGAYEDDSDESGYDDADSNTTIIAGSVLTNDTDPDGDTLSVTGHSGGDAYGTLMLNTDGSYTYTLDNTNPAVQALAEGETTTEVYTYTVDDGNSGTDTATLTITINGTNDVPVVTSTSADAEGTVVEAGNLDDGTPTAGTPSATDTLTATDVDTGAVLTWSLQGVPSTTYGSMALDSGTGVWTYTLDNLDADTQALAEGDSVTETYTARVTDEFGAYADQTITITITGTNDVPVVTSTSADAEGTVVEAGNLDDGTPTAGTPSATDTLTATDVDTGAVLTWSLQGVPSTTYGSMALDSGTGVWTYTLDNLDADTQALAEGDSVTETYTARVTDEFGAYSEQVITITINGTNDVPVISATDVTGVVTEMVDPTGDIIDTGSLTFTDIDLTDTHSISVTATSVDPLGSLTPIVTTDTTGSGLGGVIDWTYTVPAASLEYLAEGETKVETFTITLSDDKGAFVDRIITVTITGTNDAPTIMSGLTDDAGSVTEIADGVVGENVNDLTAIGTIAFYDVDLIDTHTASVSAIVKDSVGTTIATPLGSLALSAVNNVTNTVDWTYTVNDSVIDYLADGETLTQVYTVTVDDGHGGTIDQEVTVTINGTNDAPVIAVVPADDSASASINEANATLIVSDTLTLGDIDTTDTVNVAKLDTLSVGGTYTGTLPSDAVLKAMLSVTGDLDNTQQYELNSITWTFDSGTEFFDFLAVGETLTLTYQVQATDDSGSANDTSNIQDITITITGTNDFPVATANTNSIGNENLGHVDGNMITDDDGTGVDSDADISDILTVTSVAGGDTYGTLIWHMDGSYEYDVDNTNVTVAGLTGTDTLTEVYTYTLDDGNGGTDTATLTITITDDNDAPVAVDDVNTITEDVVSVAGDVTDGTVGQDYDLKPPFDTLTVTGADIGIHTSTSGHINTIITGTYGTLVIQSDGTYVYTLNNADPLVQGLSVGETLTDTFSYTISDTFGAHDTAQLDITIDGANDGVTVVVNDVNVGSGDITVEEKALLDGTQPDLTTETTSGTFVVTAPDGLDYITVDGNDVTLMQLEGATVGTPVNVIVTNGTMSITDYDSTTGTVSYIYTLSTPYTTTPSGDDGATTEIASITISATDDDGSTGGDDLDIGIVDDEPAPPVYDLDLEPAPINTNLLITFDVSGSMDWASGVAGLSRLELAKIAVMEMVYQYEALGDVRIQAVLFGGSASHATEWMTVSEAEAYLNIVTAGGSTNYDAALLDAITAFGTSGKLTTDAQNVGYFFSDGEPTAPIGSIGINATEEANWETFLNTNDIKSYAIGLGTGVSATDLEPISYDGIAGSEMPAIVVDDLSTLSSTLSATVPPPTTNLDLSGGVDNNYFGADGGYLSSVAFDGGTYEYDGVGVLTISGDTTGYSFDGTTHILTQTTDNGGTLTLDMDNGDFNYTQPVYVPMGYTDHFDYTMTDGDGDVESNIADINVDPTPVIPPINYTGTSGTNIFVGKGGDDTLLGLGGNDILSGAAGDDTIDGGTGDDNLLGGAGDDILTGGDGLDYLFGDTGDDVLNSDATDLGDQDLNGVIDGGDGFDTVTFASGQDLDLDAFDGGVVVNIEAIDLTVNGNHNITDIKYDDVISITDSDNDLWILGESADNVAFRSGNGWSQSGGTTDMVVNGATHTFYTWTNSNDASIQVYVESAILL